MKHVENMNRDELLWLVLELQNKLSLSKSKDDLIKKLYAEKTALENKVADLQMIIDKKETISKSSNSIDDSVNYGRYSDDEVRELDAEWDAWVAKQGLPGLRDWYDGY